MSWYQPRATPPDPPRYHQERRRWAWGDDCDEDGWADDVIDVDGGGSYGSSPQRQKQQQQERGPDELQRRLESLLSPMIPSAALGQTPSGAAAASQHHQRNDFHHHCHDDRSPWPHPSYKHREDPPSPSAVPGDGAAYFFYPRSGRRRDRDGSEDRPPGNTQGSTLFPVEQSQHLTGGTDSAVDLQERAGMFQSQQQRSQQQQQMQQQQMQQRYQQNFGYGDGPSNYYEGGSSYHGNANAASQGNGGGGGGGDNYRQATLAIDPGTGGLAAAVPAPEADHDRSSWDGVGSIGTYHRQLTGNDGETEQDKKQKKKKKKRKKKEKTKGSSSSSSGTQPDFASALAGTDRSDKENYSGAAAPRGEGATNGRNDNDGDSDFKKKSKKGKKRSSDAAAPPAGSQRRRQRPSTLLDIADDADEMTQATFDGIEECPFLNAGQNEESLAAFLQSVRSTQSGAVAWTMIFLDRTCTTPFVPTSRRYCTDKGPRCTAWNCTCDGQVRAGQASAPVLGAMFVVPAEYEDEDEMNGGANEAGGGGGGGGSGDCGGAGGESAEFRCFILPLGPTMNSEGLAAAIQPGFERMGRWPVSPFECDTSLSQRWDALRSILTNKCVVCVTYNAAVGLLPFHYHRECDVASRGGQMDLILPSIWDLRLASWILQSHSKDEQLEFDAMREGFSHLSQRLIRQSPPANASDQLLGLLKAKENLEFILMLYPILDKQISNKGVRSAFDDIEGPLQSVLSGMECIGIGFVPECLLGIQRQLERRTEELTAEARDISRDHTFLLSSPQQVSHLLFDIMQIQVPQGLSTKMVAGSQHRSTSEEALKAIQAEGKRSGHPHRIIDILLEFRSLNKLLTTYIRPLPHFAREIDTSSRSRARKKGTKRSKKKNAEDPTFLMRIHPMWMQTAVRTGRLSCRKPNMQQIPTEGAFGVNPRDAFKASSSDKCLFACDYSQNEIRILAHMSNDQALISMFQSKDEVDIYKQMSSAIKGKRVEDVSDDERRISKQVTLAILYGMGVPQVAKKLSVSRGTAQNFFDAFYRRFQGVRRWIEHTKAFARRHHYVTTITGRRRYLDDIQSTDRGKVAQAERQAVNTIIQGSAADLMKLAMLKMSSRVMDWNKEVSNAGGTGVPPKILLQIHDELLFEVAANEADVARLKEAVMRCCADECVQEFKIKVPLKLKCSYGLSWGTMTEM